MTSTTFDQHLQRQTLQVPLLKQPVTVFTVSMEQSLQQHLLQLYFVFVFQTQAYL
jgi:hypothetical protein